MKYKSIWSFITAISLMVISTSCAFRVVRKHELNEFEHYYILKVKNMTNDTIVLPYLIFQNYDICPIMMLTVENKEIRIYVDLNLDLYFDQSQKNMVEGNKLNFFRYKVPTGHSGLFFLPRCNFFNDCNLIDTILNSDFLLIEINDSSFTIPVSLITEVEGEIDSTYNGFIFPRKRLEK